MSIGTRLDQDYLDFNLYIATAKVKEQARQFFDSWYRNSVFREYITKLQVVLDKLKVPALPIQPNSFQEARYSRRSGNSYIETGDLLSKRPPTLSILQTETFKDWTRVEKYQQEDHSNLVKLLNELRSSSLQGHEQHYIDDLRGSSRALGQNSEEKVCVLPSTARPILEQYATNCRTSFEAAHNAIIASLNQESLNGRRLAFQAGMIPRLMSRTLIQSLAASRISALPEAWKQCIIQYALILTELQRALRLLRQGHREGEQYEHPEWLVFEIENDVSIRPIQAQIAREIISPSSRGNAVMQLNMGEGKSSIIIPIVVTTLADGSQVVRVVVLRPLTSQMRHLLIQKLGGFLGIRVYYMPVSRSMKIDSNKAQRIREMYEDCMRTGGVFLVQPEHILSFEMMVAEQTMFGKAPLAKMLKETSKWVQINSRDILDESDETLSVRFELVYTMGSQCAVDLSPERWHIVQQLLSLIHRHARKTLREWPEGLKLQGNRPGAFPLLQILQRRAGNALFQAVARDICENGISELQVWALNSGSRESLYQYLFDSSSKLDDFRWLESSFLKISARKTLLFSERSD